MLQSMGLRRIGMKSTHCKTLMLLERLKAGKGDDRG